MEKNDSSDIFSFIPKTSIINFIQKDLMIPEIKAINNQIKQKNSSLAPKFYYDEFTNQFIYLNGEIIIILNSKLKIKVFTRIKIEEKVKYITIEYNNKYLLYITSNNKVNIINLLDLGKINCIENIDITYQGGFFIPHKTPNKEHNYFILGLVSKINFMILRIKKIKNEYNEFKYIIKYSYTSKNMNILNYIFNPIFKVLLILKLNPYSLSIHNLKNKNCYNTQITINYLKIYIGKSKLYLQDIYKKLYLINLVDSYLEIYRLNNMKKNKKPIKINYNFHKEKINISKILFHFYNNIIFLYTETKIKAFDIKNKEHYEIFNLNINSDIYNIFAKSKMYGKYLFINDKFYKPKFNHNNYKIYSQFTIKDIFFTLLRRKHSSAIIKNYFFEIMNNFKISIIFEIIEQLAINQNKFIQKQSYIDEISTKDDPYQLIYIGKNDFFLQEDVLLGYFNQNINETQKPEHCLKIIIYIYHIYNMNNIILDNGLFYSILFFYLNKIKDINIIDNIIKNKVIPINDKLGFYFLIRADRINEQKQKNDFLNLGTDILLNENKIEERVIKEIIFGFIQNKKYSQAFDLLSDFFLENLFNK